jgi:uncharacterized damage-inducible protein DinB
MVKDAVRRGTSEEATMDMKMTELFAAEMAREGAISRRVLERVPEGRFDWTPHEKSMPFGYLAQLVATMPSWVVMMIKQDELDLQPPGGAPYRPEPMRTAPELTRGIDAQLAAARDALNGTTDEFLLTPWKLLVGGRVVQEQARYLAIRETINHWAHHRGQLTVYLRLLGAPVPSIYGPSADDRTF